MHELHIIKTVFIVFLEIHSYFSRYILISKQLYISVRSNKKILSTQTVCSAFTNISEVSEVPLRMV